MNYGGLAPIHVREKGMQGAELAAGLGRVTGGTARIEAAVLLQNFSERLAFEIFHRDKEAAILFADFVHLDDARIEPV